MSDPDPTAPGGMSKKALVRELHDEFGYTVDQMRTMSWPALIDALILERKTLSDLDYDNDDQAEAEVEENHEAVVMAEQAAVEVEDTFDDLDDLDSDTTWEQDAKDEAEAVFIASDEFTDMVLGQVQSDEIEAVVSDMLDAYEFAPADPNALFLGLPGGKDYVFDNHYGAGPSSADRWMTCTASLGATRSFLETLTANQQIEFASGTKAARQGTTAHAASEAEANLMLGRISQTDYDNLILSLTLEPEAEDEAYSDEMADHIADYGALVKGYADERDPAAVLIEQRVEATIPLTTYTDGEQDTYTLRGSLDLGVTPSEAHPVLVVGDLKYGNGVNVTVDANPQLRIYGLGLLEQVAVVFDGLPEWLVDITYHIVQPRLGGIKTWTEKVDDLLAWRDDVLSPALTYALGGLKGGAKFEPSEKACQFCPVRGTCPALRDERMSAAKDLFEVIQETEFETSIVGAFPETETLSGEELGKFYAQVRGLISIADDLKAEAQRRLYRGEHVPGFQLVNYSPPRVWSEDAEEVFDPDTIDDEMYPVLFERKRRSPTQALAAAKAAGIDESVIADHIIKPDVRPVVGPEGDNRKSWKGKPPEAMFDIEDDES